MSSRGLYEPDKNISAIQAFLLMAALTAPLVWTVSFRKTIASEPITVAIVTAPPPPIPVETQPAQDLNEVREQIEATKRNLEQAEVARRRAEQEAEQRRKDEERRLAEEKKREEEERKQREEEERKKQEEEQRKAEAEKKRLAEEKRLREIEAEKKRLEEERRQQELEQQRIAEAEAKARQQAAVDAKLKAARNAKLMDRYIAGIHDRVKRHLTNPDGVPTSIQVEIRVLLNDNGTLAGVPEVIEGSGHGPFDEQAVRAIILGAKNGFDLPDDNDLRSQFDELILVIRPEDGN